MSSSKVVVVTGAAGFIGSHVSEALLRRGYRVVGIDNFNDFYSRSFKERNVAEVRKVGNLEIEEQDITDGPAMSRLMVSLKPEGVIHLAAMAGVRPSIERPAHYSRINVEGTVNLLEGMVQAGLGGGKGKFVFASSSSVYGNGSKVPFSETDEVPQPISPYAATKRAGELVCYSYHHLYKMPISCLRFFTVFGPRQRPDLAIHKFVKLLHEGKPLPFFGDGSTARDYTYIDDIVSGVLATLDRCSLQSAGGGYRIYNLGGNDPVTLSRLIEEIELATGTKAILNRQPMQPGDVERTYADLTRSRAELGYNPQTSMREGLEKFVAWYRNK